MKIKFTLLLCLILKPQLHYAMNNIVYSPVASYQNMLSDMAYNLMFASLYKQTATQPILHEEKSEDNSNVSLSRDQALEEMKEITAKVFDSHDPELLGKHLANLKKLCQYLDEEQDKKTITAIMFLFDNQHKAGSLNFLFWLQAIKKYDLETAIPMKSEVRKKSGPDKLAALNKKMALQAEHLKKEQEQAAAQKNSNNQLVLAV